MFLFDWLVDHPEIIEQAGKKDQSLDDRLKKVFVTSSDYVRFEIIFYNALLDFHF
jgi:Uncharacterised protein family (UPF0240)